MGVHTTIQHDLLFERIVMQTCQNEPLISYMFGNIRFCRKYHKFVVVIFPTKCRNGVEKTRIQKLQKCNLYLCHVKPMHFYFCETKLNKSDLFLLILRASGNPCNSHVSLMKTESWTPLESMISSKWHAVCVILAQGPCNHMSSHSNVSDSSLQVWSHHSLHVHPSCYAWRLCFDFPLQILIESFGHWWHYGYREQPPFPGV